ncbi:hypothetical protein HPB48_010823 [Haemaphysalis longicornis]|uniref:Uncharacterized protein n=1 Tax=Haemaphysalis longicornis TaxID=44386 RepID=A0A9J6GVC1_HAELO|nr:hypothetical protein HPB48_010823 [Haemaphysalis longicornis]
MQITVDGEDISHEEFSNGSAWDNIDQQAQFGQQVCARARRASLVRTPRRESRPCAGEQALDIRKVGHHRVAQAVITGTNLQETDVMEDIMSKNDAEHHGSDLSKHKAMAYAGGKDINIGQVTYEVRAYFAAPEHSCKWVISGIDAALDHQELQPKNTTAF